MRRDAREDWMEWGGMERSDRGQWETTGRSLPLDEDGTAQGRMGEMVGAMDKGKRAEVWAVS